MPDPALLEQQIAAILQHLGGSFSGLLTAMVRNPALQLSLNGPAYHRGNPNENLARELAPLLPGLAIPRTGLGQQVALALRLIGSGACPPVLQLAQGGYDTHASQAVRHGSASVALTPASAS